MKGRRGEEQLDTRSERGDCIEDVGKREKVMVLQS